MTAAATTSTLSGPDAELYYEVRGHGPLVVLIGAPMDARPFAAAADLLAVDHTVLTSDPRGIGRSRVTDRDRDSTPEQRGDDLARLIEHVDAGPATVLGSSGGAVSALALTQQRPELVRTVIAHEPPLTQLLPDRVERFARAEETIATYLRGDVVGAWRMFLAHANIAMPEPVFQQVFGGERSAQEAADERFQFEHMMRPTTRWEPDLELLRGLGSRVVVGIGEASGGQFCEVTSEALAGALGCAVVRFPGGHVGFSEDAEGFVARLRETVL